MSVLTRLGIPAVKKAQHNKGVIIFPVFCSVFLNTTDAEFAVTVWAGDMSAPMLGW